MTTYELAERLARRMQKGHLTALSTAAAQDVVEAINAGLQEVYDLLPHWQRKTTVALTLAAPVAVNLSVTQGSVDLGNGGSVFLDAQVGRSVVVGGDRNWNEVQATTKLLDEYRGTTGVQAATIYGDSVYNSLATVDGFSSHPHFADTREPLILFNARAERRPGMVGKPVYYWTEPAAASLGGAPAVYLRVFPAPDVAYALRVDMEFRPAVITYAQVQAAATIPLADQLLHRVLLPLCEEALLRSPEWAHDAKAPWVVAAADSARQFLARQRPAPGIPANRIFTPPGY